jgi:hypothetical protein
VEIQGIKSYGKDILAERREKVQAQEPAGKWAVVMVAMLVGLFVFASFVQPLHG